MPTPLKRAYRTFRFFFEREPWVFEVVFGGATAGFFFLLWADWRDGPTFGSLRILSEAQPKDFWQWAGLLGGAAQSGVALLSSSHRQPAWKWPRWALAGWLACLWGSMAAGAFLASPWTPPFALYAACAIGNVYVALHVLWEDEYRQVRRMGG